jgi:sulfur-oxidizing protein SoxZ
MNLARIQFPERIVAGDVVKVRLLVQHPMDTGYLQDLLGKLVPRNVIRLLTCKLGSREVLRVELSSGIAANPLFEFFVRATETAEMHIAWIDDKGQRGEYKQTMLVSPPSTQ